MSLQPPACPDPPSPFVTIRKWLGTTEYLFSYTMGSERCGRYEQTLTPYQGNELFFGIFLLREMAQEQSLDIRRREGILLRQTAMRRDGIWNQRVRLFLGHCDARQYRLFLQRGAQRDLKLQLGNDQWASDKSITETTVPRCGRMEEGRNIPLRPHRCVCGPSMGKTRDPRIHEPSRTGNPAWLRSPGG